MTDHFWIPQLFEVFQKKSANSAVNYHVTCLWLQVLAPDFGAIEILLLVLVSHIKLHIAEVHTEKFVKLTKSGAVRGKGSSTPNSAWTGLVYK